MPFSVRMLRSLFRASAVGLVCIVRLLMKLTAHFVFLGIVSFVVMLCILDWNSSSHSAGSRLFSQITSLVSTFLVRQMLVLNLYLQTFRKRATKSRMGNYSPTKNFLPPLMRLFDCGLCKPMNVLYFYARPTAAHIRSPKYCVSTFPIGNNGTHYEC